MEFEPVVSGTAWAVLSIIHRSTLAQASAIGNIEFAELERAGFAKNGTITEKGRAALRRRRRLG